MALGAAAIVTLSEAKSRLRLANDDRNAIIESMIDAASDYVERKVGRQIVARAAPVELFSGRGTRELYPLYVPIVSVTSVRVLRTESPEAWDVLDLSTYPATIVGANRSSLYFRGYWFPCGTANVELSIVAGYSVVPHGLHEAALQAVKALYRQFEKNPDDAATITYAGNTVTMELDRTLPKITQDILAGYRRRTI